MSKSAKPASSAYQELLAFALSFPESHVDYPWGDTAVKVKKKVFVFMGERDGFGLSAKLPDSSGVALMLPFTEPTGYGLGKSGWVTASFKKNEAPPVSLMKEWIEESYRSVAPKKLAAMAMAVENAAEKKTETGTKKEARKKKK